jgi:phospholipid transport system substrate-binding protein
MSGLGKRMIMRGGFFAMALFVWGATSPAYAAETAGDWVSQLGQKVVAVLKQTKDQPTQRKSELEAIFVDSFDVDFIAKFVLARGWNTATDEQRKEFLALLPNYVATIFAGQFADYNGNGFKVTKELDRNAGTEVEGFIEQSDGPDVAATFTVTKPDGKYLITDAKVEGVSLLVTKRSEFASVLSRQGMDALISRIREILNS